MGSYNPPTHPDILRVEYGENYTSRAVSLVKLPPGALFARITTATPAKKAYTSVQVSATEHIELNSDLVFINHSCDPSLEWNLEKMEIRVAGRKVPGGEVNGEVEANGVANDGVADGVMENSSVAEHVANGELSETGTGKEKLRGIEVGDELSFFYPSSEWDMDRAFDCLCGAKECLGLVSGAKYLSREELQKRWVNPYIWRLVEEREENGVVENGVGKSTAAADHADKTPAAANGLNKEAPLQQPQENGIADKLSNKKVEVQQQQQQVQENREVKAN